MEVNNKQKKRTYGDGSTYFDKKKNRFKAVIVIGHKVDGTPIKKSKSCRTEKEARHALKELHAKHLENRLVSNDRVYFSTLFEDWLRFGINQGIRETTKQDYVYLAKKYILPYLGKKRLIDISTNEVDRWLFSLEQAGYSAITRKKARQTANMIFKFAVKKRTLPYNPVIDSTFPKKGLDAKTQKQKPLSKAEWMNYLNVFKGTELDTFVHAAALLGLRKSEILALDWDDIDFVNNVLYIRKSARECTTYRPDGSSKTEIVIYKPKTKHSKRELPLQPVLLESFQRQQIHQTIQKLSAGQEWKEGQAIFTSKNGTRLYPSNVLKSYKKIIEKNNLRYVRIHDLRHTVARLLIEQNTPVGEVSRLLGHSSIQVTLDIYGEHIKVLADRGAIGMAALYESINTKNHVFRKESAK